MTGSNGRGRGSLGPCGLRKRRNLFLKRDPRSRLTATLSRIRRTPWLEFPNLLRTPE
jgi:hypothetical protein